MERGKRGSRNRGSAMAKTVAACAGLSKHCERCSWSGNSEPKFGLNSVSILAAILAALQLDLAS